MILGLYLSGNSVSKMVILKSILIGVANTKAGPKSGIGLFIDSFLYKFFKTIEFLAALFNFNIYKKL